MFLLSSLRLRTRFILSSTLLISLLMAIVVFFVEWSQTQVTREQMREHGAALARAVADLSVNSLIRYDTLALKQNMEKAATDSDILYAVIFNRKGQALAANEQARRLFPPELLSMGDDLARLERGRVFMRDIVYPPTAEHPRLEVLEVVVPVVVASENDVWGAVKLGLSLDRLNAEIWRTRTGLISLGFFGLTLGVLGSILLAQRISRPLETLVEGTIKVAEGDLRHHITINAGDEIGELAANFNQMTAQILEDRQQIEETSHKLIQAEKLATIGRLSAAMAHEIRNPLTSIKLNIQKVSKAECLGRLEAEQLEIADRGIRQVEKIVKEILDYARAPSLKKDTFLLPHLLDDALRFAEEQLEEKKVTVVKEYAAELPPIEVDGDKLRQVFLNILLNSVEAVTSGGRIVVRAAKQEEPSGPLAVVDIEDNGVGIDPKDMQAIFEPFFTTKSLGTGLGLANARKVVELHQGKIEIESTRAVGTRIRVTLPYRGKWDERSAPAPEAEVHEVHPGH
jgi:signal transduction histidine kinase